MSLTQVQASRLLLGIITSVESGSTTPEDAVKELEQLKSQAPEGFKAAFTQVDFQRIRENYAAIYESSQEETEPEFEPSVESSY